jgi:hypothetical protein
MAGVKTYDQSHIDVVFCGVPMEGLAEDTYLEIATETERYTDKVGVDGEVSRSKRYDRRATATVTLMATSETNDRLSQLAQDDDDSPNGGVGAFEVFDRAGTSVFRASRAWIKKIPDVTYGAEVTERAWEIRLADYTPFVGSNSDI